MQRGRYRASRVAVVPQVLHFVQCHRADIDKVAKLESNVVLIGDLGASGMFFDLGNSLENDD